VNSTAFGLVSETKGIASKLVYFLIIGGGLLACYVCGLSIINQITARPVPIPGRLHEVSKSNNDHQVWKTSKARQTYRKSVLQAQSNAENTESEEDRKDQRESSGSGNGGLTQAMSSSASPQPPVNGQRASGSSYRDRRATGT